MRSSRASAWVGLVLGWVGVGVLRAALQEGRGGAGLRAIAEARVDELDPARMGARELRRLPGIGFKRAVDVLLARREAEEEGRGLAWEEVRGIGPRTAARVRAWLTERGVAAREILPDPGDPETGRVEDGRATGRRPARQECDFVIRSLPPNPDPAMHRILVPLLPLLLVSCTERGSLTAPGAGTGGSAFVDLLLRDAATDGLLSFSLEVAELRLRAEDGSLSEDLLPGRFPVELMGLSGEHEWLAGAAIPAGTYEGAVLSFTPFSHRARGLLGERPVVDALADVLEVAFALPLVLERGGYERVVVDLDLEASLVGSVDEGQLTFDPVGRAGPAGAGALRFDELLARVLVRNPGARRIEAEGLVDVRPSLSLGVFEIHLDPESVLVDSLGFVHPQAAFFLTYLTPRTSIVEIEGTLSADGTVHAARVEIESQNGVPGSLFPVKIEGVVAGVGARRIDVSIREIERGEELALPVLEGLGDAATIPVALDERTLLFGRSGPCTPSEDLAADGLRPGTEVEVRFFGFSAPPFPAARVGIGDEPAPE